MPIAIGKDQIIFVKEETSFATPTYPSGNDAVYVIGEGSFDQAPGFSENLERKKTFSKTERIKGRYEVGAFSFPTYIKPSGSLGVAPVPAALLKGVFGKETINAGVDVQYALAGWDDPIPSFTIVFKHGWIVYWNFGCVINKATIPIKAGNEDEAIVQAAWEGLFAKQVWAGEDSLSQAIDGTVTPVTSIPVTNARKFKVGAKIEIGTDDNSGSGFEITAIDYDNNTLTINPGCQTAQSQGAVVKGFVPTEVDSGYLVHGRLGTAQEKEGAGSYEDIPIIEATISIENNFKLLNAKKGTDYPHDVIRATNRNISLELSMYFEKDLSKYFYEAEQQIQREVKIPAGDTAGKRLRFEFPQVEIERPSLGGDEEIVQAQTRIPLATVSLNDEIKLIFD
jgi:hypothetical protein